MLVITQTPENAEHDQPKRDFDELRRVHGDDCVRIHAGGELHTKLVAHESHRRRGRPIRKLDGEKSPWPRLTVIVANGPTAGASDGICRRDGRRADVEDSQHWNFLLPDHEHHGERSADQSAPKHETGAGEEGLPIAKHDDVVELCTEQAADHRGEDHVAHRLRIVAATRELSLSDELCDDERHQHRDAKAGEGEAPEGVRERMVYDRIGERHVRAVSLIGARRRSERL